MGSKSTVPTIGIRHLQLLLVFLMLAVGVGMRVQFSVAIVAMTDPNATKNPDVPVYKWTNKSIMLSSFFWGYPVLQIGAAVLARLFGSKPLLLCCMIINSIICCVMPLVASNVGTYGLMVCRALMGLTQGFFYPCVYSILANWAPVSERSQMGAFALAGGHFGTITSMPLVGFISASWAGWPYSFYLYGIIGFVWVIVYYFFGASAPNSYRGISEAEREFIESGLDSKSVNLKVPWKAIFSTPAFWGLFVSTVGQTWAYQTMLSETPNYMNKVLKFDMASNGMLSATPYISSFILLIVFGNIADTLINRKIWSTKTVRRVFTLIGGYGSAMAMIILSFLPVEAVTLNVLMLIIAVSIYSAAAGGFEVNHIDLSPNFAGIILGICNSSGEVLSILGPTAVQYIVTDETNKTQWRIIFLASAVFYIVSSTIYAALVSADLQPWNNVNAVEAKTVKEKVTEDIGMEDKSA